MRIILAFSLMLTVAACSGGGRGSLASLNPFNWFGGGQRAGGAAALTLAPRRGYARTVETRPLVAQITGLVVERTVSGIIVRATAVPSSDGYYDAGLVNEGVENATLTLSFRARPPRSTLPAGPARARQLVAAIYLTHAQANGLRRVQVRAAGNSRSVRP